MVWPPTKCGDRDKVLTKWLVGWLPSRDNVLMQPTGGEDCTAPDSRETGRRQLGPESNRLIPDVLRAAPERHKQKPVMLPGYVRNASPRHYGATSLSFQHGPIAALPMPPLPHHKMASATTSSIIHHRQIHPDAVYLAVEQPEFFFSLPFPNS
jgi:hypothetical protein